ncbi:MAG: 4Fe-4S dicluster domain-containing protein [Desulfobacteraceae bacterium]|nr:MAG: 4Fe-4S dicluster domain-containing protein [Desulfobacteraceae bacterium]
MKQPKERLHRVVVVGATPSGIAAANKLGELGIPVTLIDGSADLDRKLSDDSLRLKSGVGFQHAHRPGLIRILRNPGIKCILPARVTSVKHSHQGFRVGVKQMQTFVDPDQCILCGRCVTICPVQDCGAENAVRINSRQSLPGRAVIDKRRLPLCRESCPLGVNVQGYMALVRERKFEQALDLIRERNVLPGICGRICTHPCEAVCRRGEKDGAVAIRDIKRFLADAASEGKTLHPPAPKRPEKIAVIGSGPAGLAAAAELARQGCGVTVFEKEKEAGGLLRYGIGPHRLPRNILDRELNYIRALGVETVTSHPVQLKDLADLSRKFDGVILAAGSWADRRLGMPGEDLDGVFGCIDFLSRFYRGETTALKDRVAVIGDGNAAYDLARVLRRTGADVTIVSWFAKDQIPADPEEISGAADEGIRLMDQTRVVAFEGEKGRFRRLVCRPTQPGPPDASGICWPVSVPGSDSFPLDFDRAFVAIGQAGAYGPEQGSDHQVETSERGLIRVNDFFQTSIPNVYACGDAVSGASTVVHAMAQGRAAAVRVLEDVCNLQALEPATVRSIDRDFAPLPQDLPFMARVHMAEREASARNCNFDEVALGLTEAQTVMEAGRCLQCGVCSECLECVAVCAAIGAIHHDEPEVEFLEQAGVIIIADPDLAPLVRGDDIIRAYGPAASRPDVDAMMTRGFAAAAKAMVLLSGTSQGQRGRGLSFSPPEPELVRDIRIGVFACRCNDALGWQPEMSRFVENLTEDPAIVHSEAVVSACVPEGIAAILKTVREKGITRIVLASCVCCPLNFVCSACTDQRSRLKNALFHATGISRSMVMTCNIRGEALSGLAVNPIQAMDRFYGMIRRSIRRVRKLKAFTVPVRNYNFTIAVIGDTESGLESALALADAGRDVFLFGSRDKPLETPLTHPNVLCFMGSRVRNITGSSGAFQITIDNHNDDNADGIQQIPVGAVILGEKIRGVIDCLQPEGGVGREITAALQTSGVTGIPFYYPGMTSVSGLFLANPPGIQVSDRKKGLAAAALAAAIMPRGPRQNKGYTVTVNDSRCRGCGRCVARCPYRAITMWPNAIGGWYALVDEALCKGCGNCVSACPTNAADSPFRSRMFLERTLEEILA